jgi:hypothetical protein
MDRHRAGPGELYEFYYAQHLDAASSSISQLRCEAVLDQN